MITRESLAAVLDPDAWDGTLVGDWDILLRREASARLADRLLSNPRYAVLELPEQSDGLGYCEAPVWIIGGKAPDVIAADTIIVCYPGPAGSSIDFPDEHAEAVAAAILAAHKTPLEER